MKKCTGTIVAGMLAAVIISGSLPAWAGPHNSFVDQREINQEQQIQQAWQSGLLTPGEYRRLENRQQQIREIENSMRAAGRLNPAEKTQLNDLLNQNERELDHYIHRNRRPGWH